MLYYLYDITKRDRNATLFRQPHGARNVATPVRVSHRGAGVWGERFHRPVSPAAGERVNIKKQKILESF